MKLLVIVCMFCVMSFGETEIHAPDYNPKQLLSSLKKITGCENFNKVEITLKDSETNSLNGKFFSVTCSDNKVSYVYVGRVNSCRASGCSINNNGISEGYEFFDYFTIYDSLYNVVQVNVFNYEATHGQEVTAKGWLRQFVGYSKGDELAVGKNIDAISGATISVNGIVEDVKEKTEMLVKNFQWQNF